MDRTLADAEAIARDGYNRCHPDDDFDDLKRRAVFSKEDRCLLRDWLLAAQQESNLQAGPSHQP